MSACVLTFDKSGMGKCFYSELIDLQTIGSLEVTRATTIEFNNDTQFWEVKDTRGVVLFFNKSRTACLSWENQDFNR